MKKHTFDGAIRSIFSIPRAIKLLSMMAVAMPALATPPVANAAERECGDKAGPGGARVACACGDTVVTSTKLRKSDPVLANVCLGDGLEVGADEVRLSCDWRAIVGNGVAGSTGIVLSDRRGVRVRNCRITDFDRGINIRGGGDNSIKDNRFKDIGDVAIAIGKYDRASGVSRAASASDFNRIARNAIKRSRYGIEVVEGTANNIYDNDLRDCADCIRFFADNGLVWDNYVKRGVRGISLYGRASHTRVMGNTVRDSGSAIYTSGTRRSSIVHNNVSRSDVGLHINDESAKVEVTDNEARDNGIGILVEGGTGRINFARNLVKRSERSGIFVGEYPASLTFEANELLDNGGFGIEDYSARLGTEDERITNVYIDNDCDGNALGTSFPMRYCE